MGAPRVACRVQTRACHNLRLLARGRPGEKGRWPISKTKSPKWRSFGRLEFDSIPGVEKLPAGFKEDLLTVSMVLPFRMNSYLAEELIDWDAAPDDPIFRLMFPTREWIEPAAFARLSRAQASGGDQAELEPLVAGIRCRLNPHPAGQMQDNVPRMGDEICFGLQHKYRETVLALPRQAQTCHAFCGYCFRWPQFVSEPGLRMAFDDESLLTRYLGCHPEVTDLLLTGGDPLIMRAKVLERYIEPIIDPAYAHVTNIRIGSRALAFWPYRFLTDPDADELLALFERVVASGRQLSLMAHFTHPRELATTAVVDAVSRIRSTGAVIRCQAPIARHVNDDPETWAGLWKRQVALGMVPYYMFVPRNTGAYRYFNLSLARSLEVFQGAYSRVTGLARTVRGPCMSADPGKLVVRGVTGIGDDRLFVLQYIQARKAEDTGRLLFAGFDAAAAWLDELDMVSLADVFPSQRDAAALLAAPTGDGRRPALGRLRVRGRGRGKSAGYERAGYDVSHQAQNKRT